MYINTDMEELHLICPFSSLRYSNMTTERTKWWKALLPKRKPGTAKDAPSARIYEPDFDPFAQLPKDQATANLKDTSDESSRSQQESNSFGEDTYDDSLLQSVFNEQTCRRTMKVSRSGRFKEKRRVRSSLPIQDKDAENVSPGKEEIRWWPRRAGWWLKTFVVMGWNQNSGDLSIWRCFSLSEHIIRPAAWWWWR